MRLGPGPPILAALLISVKLTFLSQWYQESQVWMERWKRNARPDAANTEVDFYCLLNKSFEEAEEKVIVDVRELFIWNVLDVIMSCVTRDRWRPVSVLTISDESPGHPVMTGSWTSVMAVSLSTIYWQSPGHQWCRAHNLTTNWPNRGHKRTLQLCTLKHVYNILTPDQCSAVQCESY